MAAERGQRKSIWCQQPAFKQNYYCLGSCKGLQLSPTKVLSKIQYHSCPKHSTTFSALSALFPHPPGIIANPEAKMHSCKPSAAFLPSCLHTHHSVCSSTSPEFGTGACSLRCFMRTSQSGAAVQDRLVSAGTWWTYGPRSCPAPTLYSAAAESENHQG